MIAHVAEAGEGRGRVVLHLAQGSPSPMALKAAILVAQAFNSELESLFVENTDLLSIAGLPFAREISFSGRQSRELSPEVVERQMRAAAAALSARIRALAHAADVPVSITVVRDDPIRALATACSAAGPWNVVALGEPLSGPGCATLAHVFLAVPGTTGLIVVGPIARRTTGRIVAVVEDIGHFEAVLRTARRLASAAGESRVTLLLVAESDAEADGMDEMARLALADDDSVEIVRARVEPGAPQMAAEVIRRLDAGFIVGRFGGLIFPPHGELRHLAAVLECPMFLIR